MDVWQIVGAVGVVFTSAQLLPQVVKSLRTRQVRDVSLGLSLVVGASAFTWGIYGIHLGDWAIIMANGFNLIGALVLLYLKLTESNAAQG